MRSVASLSGVGAGVAGAVLLLLLSALVVGVQVQHGLHRTLVGSSLCAFLFDAVCVCLARYLYLVASLLDCLGGLFAVALGTLTLTLLAQFDRLRELFTTDLDVFELVWISFGQSTYLRGYLGVDLHPLHGVPLDHPAEPEGDDIFLELA